MIAFIDESGDCGFQFERGSSEYFSCVAVLFSDDFLAEACDRAIDELRAELKLPVRYEFHFTHCSDRVRRAFFAKMRAEQFVYHAFVIRKRDLFGDRFRNKDAFYQFAVGIVCENAQGLLFDAKVVIDRCGDEAFRQRLHKGLRERMNADAGLVRIRKIAMEDSRSNNLIQLADMVCGAVMRGLASGKKDSEYYREVLRGKQKRLSIWPPAQAKK